MKKKTNKKRLLVSQFKKEMEELCKSLGITSYGNQKVKGGKYIFWLKFPKKK